MSVRYATGDQDLAQDEVIGEVAVDVGEPEVITCTSRVKRESEEALAANLTQTAAPGFEFSGWRICTEEDSTYEDCDHVDSPGPLTVQVDQQVWVTAYFAQIAPPEYALQVSVEPSGAGVVLLDGFELPVYPCAKVQTSPFTSTLEAVAGNGYAFENWTGDIPDSTDNPLEVAVTEEGETTWAIANFVPAPQIKGDFTGDGTVGIGDFTAFAQAYGCVHEDACYNATGDFNDDGKVDLEDFTAFTQAYNSRD